MQEQITELLARWEQQRSDLVKQSKDCRARGLGTMADQYRAQASQIAHCIHDLRGLLP